jgi:hypothetical protein
MESRIYTSTPPMVTVGPISWGVDYKDSGGIVRGNDLPPLFDHRTMGGMWSSSSTESLAA